MSEAEGTVETTEQTGVTTTMLGADPDKNRVNSEEGTDETSKETEEEKGKETSEVKDGEADKTEEDGAPEAYEDFTIPEGYEIDQATMDTFKPLAKELDLTQDQAQKLVDFYNDGAQKSTEESQTYYSDLMTEWQESVRTDKELGGTNFDDSLASAKAALDAFATPALYEIFEATGMGNHPEMVRVFARIGKAVKDDAIRIGSANPTAPKEAADVLFPSQNK